MPFRLLSVLLSLIIEILKLSILFWNDAMFINYLIFWNINFRLMISNKFQFLYSRILKSSFKRTFD